MSKFRLSLGLAGALMAGVCVATAALAETPAKLKTDAAKPAASATAPAQCGGTDMLAEMAKTKPELHKKVMAEAAKLSNTEAVLWKVEKPGLAPSYLFGTMHLSDKRISTLPPRAADAIKASQSVALEVADMTDNAMIATITKAPELMIYTDGKTLQAALTEDEFGKVKDLLGKAGMPGEVAGLFRPWLVSMLLAMSDCERQQIAAGAPVLDKNVEEAAKAAGIKPVGLESIEDQLGALAKVPEDQQVQMLKVGLKYADRTADMIETLVQLYAKRQLGAAMPFQIALAEAHGTPASAFDGFKTSLLVDRNAKMATAALPLYEKGKAFVAVGALHLPGDTGLVALIRKAGYTVTPVE